MRAMRTWGSTRALLAALLVAGSVSAAPPQPKVLTWQAPPAEAACFGILGEVVQPGVYKASQESVTLQDLVKQAGGMTRLASPSVRIIRGQRPGQTIFFNPQGQDPLAAGDIVVFDSLRPAGRPNDYEALPRTAPGIWVALLGVSAQPIIVPLDPDQAQIATIMLMLGQSPELARSVRVIVPPRTTLSNDPRAAVPSGTLLVFDPALLVARNLPQFPEATAWKTASLQTAAVPLPTDATADFSSVPPAPTPQVAPPPPLTQFEATPPSLSRDSVPLPPAGMLRPQVGATQIPYTSAATQPLAQSASLPAPGSHIATNLQPPRETSTSKSTGDGWSLSPLPGTDANLTDDANSAELDPGLAEIVGDLPTSGTATSSRWWQMLGIGTSLACLVGVALASRQWQSSLSSTAIIAEHDSSAASSTAATLSSKPRFSDADFEPIPEILRHRAEVHSAPPNGAAMPSAPVRSSSDERREPASDHSFVIAPELARRQPISQREPRPVARSAEPQTAAPGKTLLADLIARKVSMTTEPVDLPIQMSIQPADPLGTRQYRAEPGHDRPIAEPHFALEKVEGQVPEMTLDEATIEVRRPHFLAQMPADNPPVAPLESSPREALPAMGSVRRPLTKLSRGTPLERALSQLGEGRAE